METSRKFYARLKFSKTNLAWHPNKLLLAQQAEILVLPHNIEEIPKALHYQARDLRFSSWKNR